MDIFAPEFAPPISQYSRTCNFYRKVASFTKNGNKFGWVKYWRMTFNSPNSPKFSPATILRYTVRMRLDLRKLTMHTQKLKSILLLTVTLKHCADTVTKLL